MSTLRENELKIEKRGPSESEARAWMRRGAGHALAVRDWCVKSERELDDDEGRKVMDVVLSPGVDPFDAMRANRFLDELRAHPRQCALVDIARTDIEDTLERQFEDQPVCPHCGASRDASEIQGHQGEIVCDFCGQAVEWEAEYTRTFQTHKPRAAAVGAVEKGGA